MTNEEQGVDSTEPAVESATVSENAEANETEAQEVVETVADVEEVEVDHKVLSETLKRNNKSAEGKIEKQRAALSQANAKIQEMQQQLAQTLKVEAPLEPSIDDFETHEDYVEAVSDFKADLKFSQKQEAAKQAELQQRQADLLTEQKKQFDTSEQEYRAANPDYDRAKTELQDFLVTTPIDGAIGDAIYEAASFVGVPNVIDYFGGNGGENLAEFEKLSKMSPVGAAYEIFKLGQKLSGVKPEKSKPLPKPVKTVSGSGSSKKDLSQGDVLKNLGLK